jgi:hypothetical protein
MQVRDALLASDEHKSLCMRDRLQKVGGNRDESIKGGAKSHNMCSETLQSVSDMFFGLLGKRSNEEAHLSLSRKVQLQRNVSYF